MIGVIIVASLLPRPMATAVATITPTPTAAPVVIVVTATPTAAYVPPTAVPLVLPGALPDEAATILETSHYLLQQDWVVFLITLGILGFFTSWAAGVIRRHIGI